MSGSEFIDKPFQQDFGMSEKQLLDLCSDNDIQRFNGFAPYWASEIYGFGKHIREYGHYPKHLPLILFTDHSGPAVMDKINNFDINHDAPTVMFHSPIMVKKWREQFQKPCYNLYSPFVFYRKKNNITISKNAKGTLAYPAHTIPELDIVSSMEQYIFQLKNLPEKYQPVSVSLHYHDINKGLHKIFFRHGIPVYTAGTPFDYRFTERFYSILRNFKYTTSNIIGSYVFYAVEMNIPFFLFGFPPEYRTNTNSELADVALDCVNTKDYIIEHLNKNFSSLCEYITTEQKQLVESTLGLNDGVSRLRMAQILYFNYFKFYLKMRLSRAKILISRLKLKIEDIVKF